MIIGYGNRGIVGEEHMYREGMMIDMQSSLWQDTSDLIVGCEDPAYLKTQLLTYLGNKRSLLPLLTQGLEKVRSRLGNRSISALDAFSGSGVVSRLLKQYSHRLVSNDFESYAAVVGRCYLANASEINLDDLTSLHGQVIAEAEVHPVQDGFIRRLYAPQDELNIQPEERVFYTVENAIQLDSLRQAIENVPEALKEFFLAPLLTEASIHANTSGVFKGFYKNSQTGIGCYGGTAGNALERIRGKIQLPFPVWSRFDSEVSVRQEDIQHLVRESEGYDVAYFDPPYNQHPYGSNYFMLNLLVSNVEPQEMSRVSGIPKDWQRSAFNKPASALDAMTDMLENCKAKFCLISYNDEGFISRAEFDRLLTRLGRVEVIERLHNTFRGCRNLRNRSVHVTEQLFILEKY